MADYGELARISAELDEASILSQMINGAVDTEGVATSITDALDNATVPEGEGGTAVKSALEAHLKPEVVDGGLKIKLMNGDTVSFEQDMLADNGDVVNNTPPEPLKDRLGMSEEDYNNLGDTGQEAFADYDKANLDDFNIRRTATHPGDAPLEDVDTSTKNLSGNKDPVPSIDDTTETEAVQDQIDKRNMQKKIDDLEKELKKGDKSTGSWLTYTLVAVAGVGIAEAIASAAKNYQKACNGCWIIDNITGDKWKVEALSCCQDKSGKIKDCLDTGISSYTQFKLAKVWNSVSSSDGAPQPKGYWTNGNQFKQTSNVTEDDFKGFYNPCPLRLIEPVNNESAARTTTQYCTYNENNNPTCGGVVDGDDAEECVIANCTISDTADNSNLQNCACISDGSTKNFNASSPPPDSNEDGSGDLNIPYNCSYGKYLNSVPTTGATYNTVYVGAGEIMFEGNLPTALEEGSDLYFIDDNRKDLCSDTLKDSNDWCSKYCTSSWLAVPFSSTEGQQKYSMSVQCVHKSFWESVAEVSGDMVWDVLPTDWFAVILKYVKIIILVFVCVWLILFLNKFIPWSSLFGKK